MYLGRSSDINIKFGAPPSFEEKKKLKPNKERKIMVTHGKPKPVSPPCAPEPPQSST